MFEQRQLIELIRDRLAARTPASLSAEGFRRAAVLVPLLFKAGVPHVLFTQRSLGVPTHKGHISFPGGAVEALDADESAAALRETEEEIGVAPAEVEVLGQMDEVITNSALFVIAPSAGVIPDGAAHVTSDREVARILEVPLEHLLDGQLRQPDMTTHHWRYTWADAVIWGATARILNDFLSILGLVDPFAEDLAMLRALADPDDKLLLTELMQTSHPRGQSVAEYLRQSPSVVATPAIRGLAVGGQTKGVGEADGSWQARTRQA